MMTADKETPMPEQDPTPPKPPRQCLVVFDLTDLRHRAILQMVCRYLRVGGQDEVATKIYAQLEDSTEVVVVPEAEPAEDPWAEYFNAEGDPAEGWPLVRFRPGLDAEGWPVLPGGPNGAA